MTNLAGDSSLTVSSSIRPAAFALAVILALIVVTSQAMQAQMFTVLHTFTGGGDGTDPTSSLVLDRGGNLYGTASFGGINQAGTVFKLKHAGSGWLLTPL